MNDINCRTCGVNLLMYKIKNPRLRSYCGKTCRDKWHTRARVASGYSQAVQARQSDARASVARPGAIQCAICLRWYKRPAHHAWQRHGVSAREYKKDVGLSLTRGITTQADHDRMRLHALDNGMDVRLAKLGARTRYTQGDIRAKAKSNPWGGKGAPRP